ncbi:hypothetical protein PSTT_04651 [Puccinia striiformis]|uniref:Uncharacterized protein n=1 Tax=Puccinia striiformis TaxID=27350 RepID=A0A2S4VS36_9BASI|nr:hypothetical protein PSTT_04651 [Puccinia striiformis]
MVICKCSVCIQEVVTTSEGTENGRYLSRRNKLKHRRTDSERQLALSKPETSLELASPPTLSPETIEPDLEESGSDHSDNKLFELIVVFISWLHIFCNISVSKCRTANRMLLTIVRYASQDINISKNIEKIPKDPRTILSAAGLEVKLSKTVCCQTCFSLYPSGKAPWVCSYQRFPTSEACQELLFVNKITHQKLNETQIKGPPSFNVLGIPRCLFFSQSLESWIRWILETPDIEDCIEHWSQQVTPFNDRLSDIQHGSAWNDLEWKEKPDSHPLNLVFSSFVDWFNPRGNKTAGKIQSTGIIALTCLNLPPQLRIKKSHMFLAGIMPGPHSPDVATINHMLQPLVDELLHLKDGLMISTHKFPQGRFVQVKLLAVTGDIPANHKVAGFASHSATCFCIWCDAKLENLALLQVGAEKKKADIFRISDLSKNAKCVNQEDKILQEHGIRYSELNRLEYRHPSSHVVLGVMHNWLEGVLQHHFRYRWGFNTEDDDDDIPLEEGHLFTQGDIELFRKYALDVVLPSTIDSLPVNLGEAKAGKLKASQWYTLFAYVVPLVILDIFLDKINNIDKDSNRFKTVLNSGLLVQCTHLVSASSFKSHHTTRFGINYQKYCSTSAEIFPGLKILPNHHYALHIPQQMMRWGPLIGISEFSGERLVGYLQKINTNNNILEMHGTMMKRGCQMQRLMMKEEVDELVTVVEVPSKRNPRRINLENSIYDKLLELFQSEDSTIRHYLNLPHPLQAKILHIDAIPLVTWECSDDIRISVKPPNNCVVAKVDGKSHYGFVKEIYSVNDPRGGSKVVVLLNKITNLFPKRLGLRTSNFRHLLYLHKAIVGNIDIKEQKIVQSNTIDSLAAYRKLAPYTFGIKSDGIILTPYHVLLS